MSLVVVLIAFVLSFFLKAPPLRKTSALLEAADDHAAEQAELTRDAHRAAPSNSTEILPPAHGFGAVPDTLSKISVESYRGRAACD
ncbi:hypothetical protein [Cryobacterium fucosi]|uniref:hypothetical protein n=1 Tax=Cryobacterium fucosi TaxID=1259157 RepID=UPI00141BB10C|nr:hypothetical protein [Cryobacterium fucosi]